ncbi:amino acid permease [Acidianus ambivalens]|uniref:Amino acid permease n=2 Tax=Acidianus ambivalens TaxID=2283 RepID=A0A650CXR0_ACIAM|nr:APC family permease [Acidianus ambivalens]MQL54416.1 amino acid permease [Acidianus ambivalens]QGR22237.1 amino acid permease [Acidianus ambivalens]
MSKTLFVRESSGLKKEVSALDAIMLNLGNMSAGVALFTGISPYIPQGGIIWIAAIIGLLLTIPQAIMYTLLSYRIPRTGGDYVWISRILNGPLGVVMAFALMLESTAFFALVAFFFSCAVGTVLSTIGTMDGISSLVSLSTTLKLPVYSYLLGAVLFGVIIALNIFKAKWGYTLVTISGIIALLSTIIAMGIIAANLGDFTKAITPFLNAEGITPPSTYSVAPFSWSATLAILPLLAIYTYPWMQAVPAVASELKKEKYVAYGIFGPLILTGLLVTIGFLLLYLGGGYALTTYEFTNNGFVYTFWTVAIGLTSNQVLQWIIGIGLLVWEFAILAYGVIVFARYIFAMAFDRVFPEIFTRLNKQGSPVFTHIFDLVLTLGFLAAPIISTSGATALYGAIVIGMVYFFVVSIAGIVHGLREMKILVPISGFSAAYFIFLTYEAVSNPTFGFLTSSGSVNPITLAFVIGTFVVGGIIYAVASYLNKKKGIDITLVYKEIPPD